MIKKNLIQNTDGFDEGYTDYCFNGGPSRQDFEQFQSEIEKSPLISTIDCISLYQSISKDFFNKWESVLTDRQKFIYRR